MHTSCLQLCPKLINPSTGLLSPTHTHSFKFQTVTSSWPPKAPTLQQVCTEHDIVFIADEVVTAFGRLGHYFASEAVFGAEVRGLLGYIC